MAQDDRRADEDVARERARLSAIAEELARRTAPEYLKAQASELQEKAKVLAKDKAKELQDKVTETARDKAHEAKDAALDKVEAFKERAMANSTGMNVLGALVGAATGIGVMRFLQERREREYVSGYGGYRYGFGYREAASDKFADVGEQAEGKLSGAKAKAGEAVDAAKTKASDAVDAAKSKVGDVKEQVSRKADELREKIPSRYEMREKVDHYVHDDPFMVALGALVIGGLAGMILPLSEGERRAYRDVRMKAEHTLEQAGDMIEKKLREDVAGRVSGAIRGESGIEAEEEEVVTSAPVPEEPRAVPPDTSPSIH